MEKRSKTERMAIAKTLVEGIYEELLNNDTDDIHDLLQIAVLTQVEVNRIVFWLNRQRNNEEGE